MEQRNKRWKKYYFLTDSVPTAAVWSEMKEDVLHHIYLQYLSLSDLAPRLADATIPYNPKERDHKWNFYMPCACTTVIGFSDQYLQHGIITNLIIAAVIRAAEAHKQHVCALDFWATTAMR